MHQLRWLTVITAGTITYYLYLQYASKQYEMSNEDSEVVQVPVKYLPLFKWRQG